MQRIYTSGKHAQGLTNSGYGWEGGGGSRREEEGGRGRLGRGWEEEEAKVCQIDERC